MEALKEAIRREGLGIGSDIVKVDSFLNHRIDVALCTKMGQAFYQAFQGEQVDCILTVEASGIAVAITTAQAFGGIPVVFAKKGRSPERGPGCIHRPGILLHPSADEHRAGEPPISAKGHAGADY